MKRGIITLDIPQDKKTQIINDAKGVIGGTVTLPTQTQLAAVAMVLSQAKAHDPAAYSKITGSLAAIFSQDIANKIMVQVAGSPIQLKSNAAGVFDFYDQGNSIKTASGLVNHFEKKSKFGDYDGDQGDYLADYRNLDFNKQVGLS